MYIWTPILAYSVYFTSINNYWLWQGILLGKCSEKSNCLLLAKTGSSGWLRRIRQASEGHCVETWTKLRVLNCRLHFKDGKHTNMIKFNTKCSHPLNVFNHCHFLNCQLASFSVVICSFAICRLLFLGWSLNNLQTSDCHVSFLYKQNVKKKKDLN